MIISDLIFCLMHRRNRNFLGCFDSADKPWSWSHISCSFFTNSLLPLISFCLCSCTDFFSWAACYTTYCSKCSFGGIHLYESQQTNETGKWTVIFMVTTNVPVHVYLNTHMEIRSCRKSSAKVCNLRKLQQAKLQQGLATKTLGWTLSHTEYFTCKFSFKIIFLFNHLFYQLDYAHFKNSFWSKLLNIVEFDVRLPIYSV